LNLGNLARNAPFIIVRESQGTSSPAKEEQEEEEPITKGKGRKKRSSTAASTRSRKKAKVTTATEGEESTPSTPSTTTGATTAVENEPWYLHGQPKLVEGAKLKDYQMEGVQWLSKRRFTL
jgi:hypothetical protein